MSTNRNAAAENRPNANGNQARGDSGRRGNLGDALAAGRRQVSANPFAAIAGAAAVSAGLALLLPASRREIELTGEIADKIEGAARGAADSAMEAGRAQVETLAQTALAGIGGAMIEQVVAAAEKEGEASANGGTGGQPGAA
ncbi:hypothetical protein [Sphingomonas turrisvirgatae]|uniref:Uncharacterized protein n=1 Tax=Sphingomonas turrisvirgatae TaxID=1888892 RepID=A0A1E3LXL2_9SPHN|nr:hypothetical protein [Sphingomonas turrisvirgatae]ODP37895.1 hypothetical protein BFL28_16545 [Sphingomonas turrisvirgatae]